MAIDCSLVRLHVRDDSVYIDHGNTVMSSQRDGYLAAKRDQGLFVRETRLLSRYRCLLNDEAPQPVALSEVAHDSWLGYYILAAPGHSHESGGLTAPQGNAVESFLKEERPRLVLKRRGRPQEVGCIIACLLSERAAFVNGANYRIDGGSVQSEHLT